MRVGQNPSFAMVACSFALAACNSSIPDDRVCVPPSSSERVVVTDKMSPELRFDAHQALANACIRQWAYRLAPSQEAEPQIVSAVLTACSPELDRLRAQTMTLGRTTWLDDRTGTATNPYLSIYQKAERQAHFRIAQARLGHCKP